MPKKPTEPFGYISFSKFGKVEKHVETLSFDKPVQECQVAATFLAAYNEAFPGKEFWECRPLDEDDHDFLLVGTNKKVYLQVTELVARSYTFEMTQEEYGRGDWEVAIQRAPGGLPWRIDIEKRDAALLELITKKQDKHYAREAGRDVWLLVFTTDTQYLTEYCDQGKLEVSAALYLARERLQYQKTHPFDQIWFTNLMTRPMCVWPAAQ